LNVRTQSYSFGPATSGDQTGNGQGAAKSQAFRLQLGLTSSWRAPAGAKPNASFFGRFEKDFALSVDTTDQKTGYIDNNSVSAGFYRPSINIESLLAQGQS